jgi:hypothetical protein
MYVQGKIKVSKSTKKRNFQASPAECFVIQSRVARWYILKPKKSYLGKFWGTFQWEKLVYSTATWNILRPFATFYANSVN